MSSSAEQQAANDRTDDNAAEQADRCRRLANATYDRATAAVLEQMAVDFDQRAKSANR